MNKPKRPSDQPSADDYFHAVGVTLTVWGKVEESLCGLFTICMSNAPGHDALERAYWSIISFDARREMVNAALTEYFAEHKNYLLTWEDLNNRLWKCNKNRNKVAHGSVQSFVDIVNGRRVIHSRFYPFLHSRWSDYIQRKPGAEKLKIDSGFSFGDIKSYLQRLKRLDDDICKLSTQYIDEQMDMGNKPNHMPGWLNYTRPRL